MMYFSDAGISIVGDARRLACRPDDPLTGIRLDIEKSHRTRLALGVHKERAHAFAPSPKLRAPLGKTGVHGAPDIRFVNMMVRSKA